MVHLSFVHLEDSIYYAQYRNVPHRYSQIL